MGRFFLPRVKGGKLKSKTNSREQRRKGEGKATTSKVNQCQRRILQPQRCFRRNNASKGTVTIRQRRNRETDNKRSPTNKRHKIHQRKHTRLKDKSFNVDGENVPIDAQEWTTRVSDHIPKPLTVRV